MKIVKIKQGVLKGTEKKTLFSDKIYYSYLNIPYAKPPVGDLRFQSPQPHDGWSGVYYATKFGNVAPQKRIFPTPKLIGDEDCLYLHVHVPQSIEKDKSLKPVMVFFHGGGFNHGSCEPSIFGPDFLMEKDVILVGVNYRLNVLGFLNLGLPECSGNMGLKDQALALKWVKSNIAEFGGNPQNVTAFGESAGAASVHFHMISPKGQGLFNRAILQSGSALNSWAFSPVTVEASLRLVLELGLDINDKSALLRSLRNVSIPDLFEAASAVTTLMLKSGGTRTLPFVPSKEILEDKSDAYLPEEPEVLMQSANPLPLITGLTEREGLLIFLGNDVEKFSQRLSSGYHLVPMEMNTLDQPLIPIAAEINKYYFNNRIICEETFSNLVDYFTDVFFTVFFYRSVNRVIESQCPVYVYQFMREDAINYRKIMFSALVPTIKGTTHGDELGYIFLPHNLIDNLIPLEAYNSIVLEAVDDITSYWTNFAKTGNPNGSNTKVEWLPHLRIKPRYLRIDHVSEMKDGKLFNERLNFWETVFEKISRKSYENSKCRL